MPAGALRVHGCSLLSGTGVLGCWGTQRDRGTQSFGVQYSVSLPAPCSTLFQEPGNSTTA